MKKICSETVIKKKRKSNTVRSGITVFFGPISMRDVLVRNQEQYNLALFVFNWNNIQKARKGITWKGKKNLQIKTNVLADKLIRMGSWTAKNCESNKIFINKNVSSELLRIKFHTNTFPNLLLINMRRFRAVFSILPSA